MADHLAPERVRAAVLSEPEERHLEGCVRCRGDRRLALAGRAAPAEDPRSSLPPAPNDASDAESSGPAPRSAFPYRLGRVVGSGGMGVVVEAVHRTRGTRHAVKRVRVPDPDLRARMLREARLQARVDHENVVPVEEILQLGDAPALVMPFIEGPTLERVLARHRLPEEAAIEVFRGIVGGVAAIHRAGLVHRDLKPGNVLLERVGDRIVPRVSDFGLAKALGTGATVRTRPGAVLGTPAYAAPEQLVDAASVGPAADVWALGCLLYELLAGRPLAGSDGHPERAVPPAWSDLVGRCLRPEAAERPPDAGVVLDRLPPPAPADLRPFWEEHRPSATFTETTDGAVESRGGREPEPAVLDDRAWEALDPFARRALVALARLDPPFTVDQAESAVDLPEPEAPWMPDLLDQLRERGLVASTGDGGGEVVLWLPEAVREQARHRR